MKKLSSYMLLLVAIAGCSSGPQYEKMRTADDALNKYDQNVVKDGMAITKKGAVIDITIEEVQAQKNRLAAEVAEKDKKIEYLQDRVTELEQDQTQLRLFVGLPGSKPKSDSKCCTADGRLIPGKPVPTLAEELAGLKKRRRVVNSQPGSVTAEPETAEED